MMTEEVTATMPITNLYGSVDLDSKEAKIDNEKVARQVYNQILRATGVHHALLKRGFARIEELLLTLEGGEEISADGTVVKIPGYLNVGYNPVCGTIVENLANDLSWEMCVVTNTYDTVDEDEEKITVLTAMTPHSRRTGFLEHGNDPDEVRPPQAGIRALWGEAPDIWMMYQLLEAEKIMRFERYHYADFEEIDFKQWIKVRFEHWVGCKLSDEEVEELPENERDQKNTAFQEYFKKQKRGAQMALFDWIVEPFEMIDGVVNDWFDDFDKDISVYTYLSFLGQDMVLSLICFTIQVCVPIVLGISSLNNYYQSTMRDTEDDDSLEDDDENGSLSCVSIE